MLLSAQSSQFDIQFAFNPPLIAVTPALYFCISFLIFP